MHRTAAAAFLLVAVICLAACGGTSAHGGTSPSRPRVSASASDGSPGTGKPGATGTGTELGPGVGQYPWAIRLRYSGAANGTILATDTGFADNRIADPVFASTDQGRSFSRVGTIAPGVWAGDLCCTSLLELPRRVGALPPGTVLWSGAENAQARPMSLPVWRSEDHGRTWTRLSTCYTSPNDGGVWEPELSLDASGRLHCYFSDESDPAHSQTLARTVSSDGIHWGPKQPVVALPEHDARPGMAVVQRLTDGRYLMTYELCGAPGPQCAVHDRLSPDGSDWGSPAAAGTPVLGPGGLIPEHTPKFTVAPDGRIVLGAMVLGSPDGSPAPGSGAVLLVNGSDGTGPWSAIPAPVTARGGECANYSPALLPVGAGGKQLLEITTRQEGPNCRAYYGTGAAAPNSRVHGYQPGEGDR